MTHIIVSTWYEVTETQSLSTHPVFKNTVFQHKTLGYKSHIFHHGFIGINISNNF